MEWGKALEYCLNDESFLKEMMGDLLRETRETVLTSEKALELNRQDWPAIIHSVAHSLKGACDALMCFELYRSASSLANKTKVANPISPNDYFESKAMVAQLKVALFNFDEFCRRTPGVST